MLCAQRLNSLMAVPKWMGLGSLSDAGCGSGVSDELGMCHVHMSLSSLLCSDVAICVVGDNHSASRDNDISA